MASSGPGLDICDILQERIEEFSFVDDAQKLKKYCCCTCGNVAIGHCIGNCGDVFCTKCYLNYFRKACPTCEAQLTSNKEDDEYESAVLELKVKCKFTKNGCKEIISVIDFLKHIKRCKFTSNKQFSKLYRENSVAEYINQDSDDTNKNKTAKNEDLKKVEESVKGQMKHKMMTLHSVNSQMVLANKDEIRELTKNMLKAEISTENKIKEIGQDFKRHIDALYSTSWQNFTEEWNNNKTSIQAEIQDLKNEMQESRNQNDSFRASFEGTINSLVKKIDDNFNQTKEALDEMQTEFTNLKHTVQENEISIKTSLDQNKELELRHRKRLDELEIKMMSTSGKSIQLPEQQLRPADDEDKFKDVFMWKISGFKEKWQSLTTILGNRVEREEWLTTQQGLQFKPTMWRFNSSICIALHFSQDRIPSSPFLHSRKYILIDQINAVSRRHVELIDRPKFKNNSHKDTMELCLSYTLFFPLRILEGKNNYVKNDEILIRIVLEPISILWKQIECQDGVFLWRIEDYSKRKEDAMSGIKTFLTSKPFKTSHVMGYTAYLQLYLNPLGSGEGKYIHLSLYFVSGEHDASLPLPFKCNYEFSLLDQSDSLTKENISQEYNHEFEASSLGRVGVKFVLQSSVESSKYLKNDSISLRTTLKML